MSYDNLFSDFAFKFNLRRYKMAELAVDPENNRAQLGLVQTVQQVMQANEASNPGMHT